MGARACVAWSAALWWTACATGASPAAATCGVATTCMHAAGAMGDGVGDGVGDAMGARGRLYGRSCLLLAAEAGKRETVEHVRVRVLVRLRRKAEVAAGRRHLQRRAHRGALGVQAGLPVPVIVEVEIEVQALRLRPHDARLCDRRQVAVRGEAHGLLQSAEESASSRGRCERRKAEGGVRGGRPRKLEGLLAKAVRSHWTPSEAIGRHQKPSDATRRHQTQ